MSRKKIFIQGYGCSGGTLVGDFLYEFDKINYLYRTEFDLFRGAGGIYELGQLLGNGSLYTKDSAVRRFMKLVKFLDKNFNYRSFYGENFEKYSDEFVQSLIEYECPSELCNFCINERIEFPKVFFRKLLGKRYYNKVRELNINTNIYYVKHIEQDEFTKLAFNYMNKIFDLLPDNPIILHHTFINNIPFDSQLDYFDNYKVIVVDKDPRDIYVFMRTKIQDTFTKYCEDIDTFIKIFKTQRQFHKHNIKILKNNVLDIKCEDFIKNYDEVSQRVIKFLGFDEENHIHKFKYFNPEISKQYVQAYKNYEHQDEIKKLEKELAEYLIEY